MKPSRLPGLPLAMLLAFPPLTATRSQAAKAGLNFQAGSGAPVTDTSFGIPLTHWINLPQVPESAAGLTGSTTVTLPDAGEVLVEWSAKNTWQRGGGVPATPGADPGADQATYGYLDDTAPGYQVRLSGLRNAVSEYKVTLIAATDNGTGFSNATLAYGGESPSLIYGVPDAGTIVNAAGGGVYALTPESAAISALTGNNTITFSGGVRNGSTRATLAAILIDYTPATANAPLIEASPVSPEGSIFTGQSFELRVAASGTGLSYQWRKNGTPIAGAPDSPVYTKTNASPADDGNYDVIVSGTGPAATSAAAAVTVSPLFQPVFVKAPVNATPYAGYTTTFSSLADGGQLTYSWKKGDTVLAGQTGPDLTLTGVTPADAGTYTVTATNPTGSVSSSATLTLKTAVPGSAEAVQASLKPLLWYRYSETGNEALQDSTPNTGSLGSSANGTGIFTAWNQPGALASGNGTSVRFNGSTSRLLVPWSADLNPSVFSVEAWVKPAVALTGDSVTCVMSSGDFASPRAGWLIYQSATGWNLRFYNQNDLATSLNLTGGTAPEADTWYHLAATFDGTTAILYVNGEAVTGTPDGYVPGLAGGFSLGARADSGFYWNGWVDEAALYGGVLTAAKVQARHQNGLSATPATPYGTLLAADNPLLHLRLDDPVFVPVKALNQGMLGAAADGEYRGTGTEPGNPLVRLGEAGPAAPEFPGLETGNTALTVSNGWASGTAPLSLGNEVTFTTWIRREPVSTTGDLSWPGWLGDGGMHLNNGSAATPDAELRYHWKGEKWGWASGLFVPPGVWTFAAIVVEPARATIYMSDLVDGRLVLRSAVNTTTHNPLATTSPAAFGGNQPGRGDRNFIGQLDESSVYGRALSPDEIFALFQTGSGAFFGVDIAPGGILTDTKSTGTPLPALNQSAEWLASDTDLSASPTTREGVLKFAQTENDQIRIPHHTDFDSPTGTFSFWMRSPVPTGSGSEAAMLVDRRTGSGLVITLADTGNLFIQTAPGNANSFSTFGLVSDDFWHHIAVTWNQDAAGSIAVYIDGQLDVENTATAAWSWPAGQQIELGRSHDPYWKRYDGLLDDFRVYNRILSAAEIETIRTTGGEAAPSALKVRYDFGSPGTGFTLAWPYGTLESSSLQPGAPWTPVENAVSPQPFMTGSTPLFFRARIP